jgi:hypothetical protein
MVTVRNCDGILGFFFGSTLQDNNKSKTNLFCFLVDSDNSRVRYSIIGGDLQSNFTIHRTTGELSVTHPLDFELLAPSIL